MPGDHPPVRSARAGRAAKAALQGFPPMAGADKSGMASFSAFTGEPLIFWQFLYLPTCGKCPSASWMAASG